VVILNRILIFCRGKPIPNRSQIATIKNKKKSLKLIAFNCKNIKTCALVINELFQNYNILLLQEHWLFDFQLNLISEIGTDICYEAKAVDMISKIQPAQVPRGYGGVAIIWKKQIDHLIK
jgi:hypothetical protein